MVRSMVLGGEAELPDQQCEAVNDCIDASYHKAVPNIVLLAYVKEVSD